MACFYQPHHAVQLTARPPVAIVDRESLALMVVKRKISGLIKAILGLYRRFSRAPKYRVPLSSLPAYPRLTSSQEHP